MCTWVWGAQPSRTDIATLSVNGFTTSSQSKTFTQFQGLEDFESYTLYDGIETQLKNINAQIPSQVNPLLSQAGLSYESSSLGFNGPIKLTFSPNATVTLSGMHVYGTISASGYYGPIKVTCTANANVSPSLSGHIDITSGKVSSVTIVGNTGNVAVSDHCSTNIGIVDPLINFFIGQIFPDSTLDALLSNQTISITFGSDAGIVGLADSLHGFVINGVDYGAAAGNSLLNPDSNGVTATFYDLDAEWLGPLEGKPASHSGRPESPAPTTTAMVPVFDLSVPHLGLDFNIEMQIPYVASGTEMPCSHNCPSPR